MEFKVGDKVKVIQEYDDNIYCVGKVGKVLYVMKSSNRFLERVYVQFEFPFIMGHNANGYGEDGCCWIYPKEGFLELVNANLVELI